jgi:hypothetical protein
MFTVGIDLGPGSVTPWGKGNDITGANYDSVDLRTGLLTVLGGS